MNFNTLSRLLLPMILYPFFIHSCQCHSSGIPVSLKDSSTSDQESMVAPDSFRYVIKTFYYDAKTDKGKSIVRIVNGLGKILFEGKDGYTTSQTFNALHHVGAKLYLVNETQKKFISVDRSLTVEDLSDKYRNLKPFGENCWGLYTFNNDYDVFNPNGEFLFNTKDYYYYTEYKDGVISVFRNDHWEIRDKSFKLIHSFPNTLQTVDVYPNHGLHPSSDGLIRIDKGKGKSYFVNHSGQTVLDLETIFPRQYVMNVFPPSNGTLLVKYYNYELQRELYAFVDTTGRMLWNSEKYEEVEARSFSNGFGMISFPIHDIDSLQREAEKNGSKSISVEMKTLLIDRTGNEMEYTTDYRPILKQYKHLYMTTTPLQTLDNRLNGYAIFDQRNHKKLFESEWPILFFDEHVVMVGEKDVYLRESSKNLVMYDFSKKVIWRVPAM